MGCCQADDSEEADPSTPLSESNGKKSEIKTYGHDSQKKTTKKKNRRSGSMQYLWSVSWAGLIGERTAKQMKKESLTPNCDGCNCVERAIFVMNIYKFWNDRKHIELDIDHIIEVITKDLDNYSKEQMISDFKHCQTSISMDELNDLFQTKCKNCGGDDCPVLQRKTKTMNDAQDEDGGRQRMSTLYRINEDALQLMNILDDYHCYFLHKIDCFQSIQEEEDESLPPPPVYNPNARAASK
eukprot:738715_1